MNIEELEQSNRSKYGEKEHDQISNNYRISKSRGDIWCVENIFRYLGRFSREGSSKANNTTDLLKAKDYLNRMIEANTEIYFKQNNKKEIIE